VNAGQGDRARATLFGLRKTSLVESAQELLSVVVCEKQKVRLRPGSPVAHGLGISAGAIGTVICRYRILREGDAAPDRMDVRFDDRRVAWGVPEKEFEVVTHVNNV